MSRYPHDVMWRHRDNLRVSAVNYEILPFTILLFANLMLNFLILFYVFRSVKLTISPKLNIVDALWHKNEKSDTVVCLTSDYCLRFFKVKNPKMQYKEFHLNNVISDSNLQQYTGDKSGK